MKRSSEEVLKWVDDELLKERKHLRTIHNVNSVGAGMSMGAIDALERFRAWLIAEDEP